MQVNLASSDLYTWVQRGTVRVKWNSKMTLSVLMRCTWKRRKLHREVKSHSQDLPSKILRWPNTVFARAFADVIQRVHKDCKNKHVVNRAIILFIHPHYLRYFSILLNAVYWWLYSVIKKDMLGKVMMQRTQKFLAFLCYRNNPVKCSACAVLEKLRPNAFAEICRFLTIQSLEFQEIWQKNSSEIAWMIYHKKSEI